MPPPAARKTPATPLEQVYVKTRAAWRRWLAKHHARSPGIWLVYDKKKDRADRLAYVDAVEEALCFGWIDSTTKSLDDARYMQLFTPRKPKSTWARTNKARVARLIEDGVMAPAGLAVIEVAKANGSWSSLDAVEALTVSEDLAAALTANPAAARNFATFPPSAQKAYLHWVSQAVRPATRAERIAAVVLYCAANRKSRHPAPAPKPA
ncbi:MAG: YdeI/OmpD-associated family protein [Gemmatimonadaceae bacterium]